MKININKLDSYDINPRDEVTLVTYNSWLKEILYVKNKNTKGRIKLLPGGMYKNTTTGEIKQCKKQIDNRSQGVASLKKTFKSIREAINVNCEDVRKCKMITLTYKEKMVDTKKLYDDFKKFNMKFKYRYGNYEYIMVCEPQSTGSFHIHVIYIWEDIVPYLDYDKVVKMWNKGYIKILPLYGNVENLGAYFTAHLSDLPVDECNMTYEEIIKNHLFVKEVYYDAETKKELKEPKYYIKGARLKYYPPKFNIYRHSKGIKKPGKDKMEYRQALKKVGSEVPTFESTIQVKDNDGNELNIIVRECYNSRRFPLEDDKEPELVFNILDDISSSY